MVATTKTNRSNTPRKPANGASFPKKPARPDASILSFFQKTQKQEESLFVEAGPEPTTQDEDIYDDDDDHHHHHRFNESGSPIKKRRLSDEQHTSADNVEHTDTTPTRVSPGVENGTRDKKPRPRINVPFLMDSDSEDEAEDDVVHKLDGPHAPIKFDTVIEPPEKLDIEPNVTAGDDESNTKDDVLPVKEEDSTSAQFVELGAFAGLDDLYLDEFEGEEMREMREMREQARLEAEELGTLFSEDFGDDHPDDNPTTESCPICNGSLAGVSADDATRHVNSCLDGNPTPLPKKKSPSKETAKVESAEIGKRFARAAVPRPGQANPFELDGNDKQARSAFSKLMSNKAESSAWATAAAAEHASRGRPAYERTCPFYKIIPGFNICVDAFRYGAVKGCEAYFLSHFHSDHYIGLTGNWRHGPIYCSKVTGRLVKQQLRTASKWVVELEFEKSYDIPGTGATVTMIPANHCPGSSLFLFEKSLDKGANKRMQRILHCGDFRACPEHVGHPLLKPDVVDSITGKTKQQTINMCYLDTTYLNPRYSFPPQDDVIKACADLCASMSPDPNCKDLIWERSAKAAGTPAVSKYFQSDKAAEVAGTSKEDEKKLGQRLLVICGTYSIGKERICISIAKALGSKIFATPSKMKLCKQLDDPELASLLTSNPVEAQVHMQPLMEIRAETLQDYLNSYRPHFSRIVGFRPSGWNFRRGSDKSVGANTSPNRIPTDQLLHGKSWRTRFACDAFVAQRGSTKEAMCFGVPYSEHSSFRELAMFLMCLRIEKVIPTVNVGSEQSRKRMRGWIDRWTAERRRGGLVRPLIEGQDEDNKTELWEGKSGNGGGAWW
ncbi:DNA cross-link repair protein pso2/snm1 [Tolypocladium ophioglossoides CBS 100239]|uniref:DNA cross-link repair protein pso2/snm1 n=1 Tax=Tolypocladium ophioglossoides (strain CBS 100239) TaxID=1163406 RepID=A0A0L0NL53_TOLOC|nr:DNA cross-link repair protein pso2/snm1 [Tolypocladium ophioglossoides CBS 100239]